MLWAGVHCTPATAVSTLMHVCTQRGLVGGKVQSSSLCWKTPATDWGPRGEEHVLGMGGDHHAWLAVRLPACWLEWPKPTSCASMHVRPRLGMA